jgi:dipeptidyl aminopeptidase/acylaminoacyl peptidase
MRYQTAADLRADLKRLKRDTDTGQNAALGGQFLSASASPDVSSGSVRLGERKKRKLALALGFAFVLVALAGTLVGVYKLAFRGRPAGPNPQNIHIARLTDNGNIRAAALSPDGRYVAYVSREVRPTLWVRQVAAPSAVPLLPAVEASYYWVAFSPDGDYIYFSREIQNFEEISVAPALGGAPRPIVNFLMSTFGAGISPDGKRIAFIRHSGGGGEISELTVANTDGTGEHVVAEGLGPEYFGVPGFPSWSPDGKLVAAPSWWNKGKYLSALRCFPTDGGKPFVLLRSEGMVLGGAWLPDQSGILVALPATSQGPRQIWLQPFPRGTLQQITNDLKDYSDLSLSRDGKVLSAVEEERSSVAFAGSSSDPDRGVPITTARRDGLALTWMPHGMLLLRDSKSEFSLAKADGSGRIPLFRDEGYVHRLVPVRRWPVHRFLQPPRRKSLQHLASRSYWT